MKIVIDIPEETYRYMQSRFMYQGKDDPYLSVLEKACIAIKNGTILKQSEWIYTMEDWNRWTCPICGWSHRTDIHVRLGYNYCPKCGTDMRGNTNADSD